MSEGYKIVSENGDTIMVSILGAFRVEALNKEYAMYSLVNDNPDNENGAVLLGEVVREDGKVKVLDILEEEVDLVVAFYNEIANQIGEKNNG